MSRDRSIMLNAGGSGIEVIRRLYSTDHPHCDMVHRPAYDGDLNTNPKQKQCDWSLTADVCAFDNALNPLGRG